MGEPVWIRDDVGLAIHARQLAEHGGAAGVRDAALLSSALARPRQLRAYADPPADLPQLAAAYAFGIARNHPFVDGNKRTAFVVCVAFLRLNGLDLDAGTDEKFQVFLDLAAGKMSEASLAEWIRGHLKPRP